MTTTNLPRYKSAGNAHLFPKTSLKKMSKISLTVPDQALSMRQIFERHTRGLPIPNGMEGYYAPDQENISFDDFMPNTKTLDLSEIADIAEASKKQMDNIKSKGKQFADKKQKDAWIQEYKKANEPKEPPKDGGLA